MKFHKYAFPIQNVALIDTSSVWIIYMFEYDLYKVTNVHSDGDIIMRHVDLNSPFTDIDCLH